SFGMTIDRKTFLRHLGVGSIGAVTAGSLKAAAPKESALPEAPWPLSTRGDAQAIWRQVRAHYAFREGLVYLNCGGLGPTPRRVLDVYEATAERLQRSVETGHNLFEEARKVMAGFLGARLDEIGFTR